MAALNLDSFAASQRYPAVVYSLHPSLYVGLDAGLVQILDDAAMLGRGFFAYPQAMALLDRLPIPERLSPAVAIEKGQLLLSQRRHGEATRFLHDALENAKGGESAMDKWDARLLHVMHAYALCFSKGDFESGVKAMHDIRVWLEHVALEDYTDIQVDCVQYYYSIALLGRLEMRSFDETWYGDFPRFIENDGLWAGMTRVREYLQGRGRLVEALHLLAKELIFTAVDQKEKVIRSFLDDCARCPVPAQPIWLLKRTARLLLSDFLRDSGSHSTARDELSKAQLISRYVVPLSRGDIGRHNDLLFSFKDAEMENTRDYDPAIMFDKWVEIADEAKSLENFPGVDQALCKAINIADTCGRQTCRPPWTERFFSMHARLEALYRQQESVFWLLHKFSVTVPNFADLTLTGCGDALQWISAAKLKYRDFRFTGVMVRLEAGRGLLAMRIGRYDLLVEAAAEASQELDRERVFWDSHIPPTIQVAPRRTVQSSSDANGSFWAPMATKVPFSHVNNRTREVVGAFGILNYMGTEAEPDQVHWQILLQWMREDYSQEGLTGEELRRILPVVASSGISEDGWDTFLTQLNGRGLYDMIMNCDIRQWSDIRDAIFLWLRRAEHRPEVMREFFACLLQRARLFCGKTIAFKDADLVITEALKFINLLGSIESRIVREVFSKQAIAARRLICDIRANQIRQLKCTEDIATMSIEKCVFEYSQIIGENSACGWQDGEALDLVESVRLRLFAKLKLKCSAFPIEDMIRDLNRAVDIFTDWRRAFTTGEAIESVRNQEAQISLYWPFDPHQLAVAALSNEPKSEKCDIMMWNFIQKAKARALSEFMGLEMTFTDSMIEKGSLSPESMQLLLDEKIILASLNETDCLTQRAQLREVHKDILSKMKSRPDLTTIVSVRDCMPFTFDDMQAISRVVDGDVVFVDWFIIDSPCQETKSFVEPIFTVEGDSVKDSSSIILTTARAGQPPKTWPIDLKVSDIEEWFCNGNFGDNEMGILSDPSANERLEYIAALVAPLESASKPGELLVICPTKLIHRLPLHALKVGGEVLIRRNPVIYAYSLSQLRHCFFSYQQGHAGDSPDWEARVLCLPESNEGRVSAREFGKLVDAEPLLGSAVTKSRFVAAIEDNTFLHFRGHCSSDGRDLVDKYLQFPDNEKLTVRELFRIPRAISSYHVNILACASGETLVSSADNSLGLTTAFLHCGATSTISTMWRLGDPNAVIFERAFGRAVWKARQCSEVRQRVVNIAKIVQEVVCEIIINPDLTKKGEGGIPPPHYWAQFVAHGFWLMRV